MAMGGGWVLEADIEKFFDSVDHAKLREVLSQRVRDGVLTRLIGNAKHRTKKEIAKLVRILDPLPAVPARIEALGPPPFAVVHSHPTWAEQVASFCPVRELLPGDRPADWVEEGKLSVPERMEPPLLSNRGEENGIEQIHLHALRLLVERHEKRRFGAPESPAKNVKRTPKPAVRRSRHIPSSVRRVVFGRDGARCTYVDGSGQRCRETHQLELHHLVPFARGGVHTATNLTRRCAAHNAPAAELDFGAEQIGKQRDPRPHESERRAWRHSTLAALGASTGRGAGHA